MNLPMLDHVSLGTTDLARAAAFYDASLALLGIVRVWSYPDAVGYGYPGGDDKLAIKQRPGFVAPGPGFHLALTARVRSEVDAFFEAAIAHGGKDDGPPGLRPRYGPNYYAAFVVGPDGHRLEVVCHGS
jgi:catechol 2,3-dioxygenase-like lactoylglutathione lyase family enzyme